MSDQLDINDIASRFIQANLESMLRMVSRGAKGAQRAVRARLEGTYSNYVLRILAQYSTARSIVSRTEPYPLYDIFVPLDLASQRARLPRAAYADVVGLSPRTVVTGLGGSGKTMLMRHLLVGSVVDGRKTPVFVELRQLNRQTSSLTDLILTTLRDNGLDVDHEFVSLALSAGRFALLLDGFDELNLPLREPIADEIKNVAIRYPDNHIVMSSRPDIQLAALETFVHVEVQPLDMGTAVELVAKLPYDRDVKEKFVLDLKKGLFAAHTSFLSNPLLLSIMLLTYSDVAHIPSKLSLFYEQAYEALFQKHDAYKGAFRRERRTTLDIQDFALAFSTFCLLSYGEGTFEFSRTAALELMDRGKNLAQIEYESAALLDDSLQAVCLLLEDGLNLAFVHRSFQEYFVARYVSKQSGKIKDDLIRRLSLNASHDAVMLLLYEMDQTAVERLYILPHTAKVRSLLALNGETTNEDRLALLKLMFRSLMLSETPDGFISVSAHLGPEPELLDFAMFMARQFPPEHGLDNPRNPPGWPEAIKELVEAAPQARRGQKNIEIPTASLHADDPLFSYLVDGDAFFAASTLDRVLSVEREIMKRHSAIDESIQGFLREVAGSRLSTPTVRRRPRSLGTSRAKRSRPT